MNYTYYCEDTKTGKISKRMIQNVHHPNNIKRIIHLHILEYKRDVVFDKLFSEFDGDIANVNDVKEYLPPRYKQYANNLEALRKRLVSLPYIIRRYNLMDIQIASSCLGCLHDSSSQRNHMGQYGCLVDRI